MRRSRHDQRAERATTWCNVNVQKEHGECVSARHLQSSDSCECCLAMCIAMWLPHPHTSNER